MKEPSQTTRNEFMVYWERHEEERSSWRSLLPHLIYIGGLAVYAIAVRRLDTDGRFWMVSIGLAIVYIIGLPWVWVVTAQRKNARFIRCPQCGDWLGRDASGDWFGPNPNWKLVGQTGKCTKCGRQLFTEPSGIENRTRTPNDETRTDRRRRSGTQEGRKGLAAFLFLVS